MTRKSPVYLFSRKLDIWKKILFRLSRASSIELFLDYDGTLTPIRHKPSAAVLAPETELLLQEIVRLPDVHLSIVTGRSMEDIRRLVPSGNITFVANHGFHVLHEGKEWLHPEAVKWIRDLKRLDCILKDSLAAFPKVNIENKQLTVSVHYRGLADAKIAPVRSIVTKTVYTYDHTLKITEGKKVLEVRPNVKWGKGDVVLQLLKGCKKAGRPSAVFVGDDQTDEDAFIKLRPRGITIRVEKKFTNAEFYVKSVEEVIEMIRALLLIRKVISPGLINSREV